MLCEAQAIIRECATGRLGVAVLGGSDCILNRRDFHAGSLFRTGIGSERHGGIHEPEFELQDSLSPGLLCGALRRAGAGGRLRARRRAAGIQLR